MDRKTCISIALLLPVALALGIFWMVGKYAEGYFAGTPFATRFPEKTLYYTTDQLQQLSTSACGPVIFLPVLFPLDLIVMLALSLSMGAAIWYWLNQISPAWASILVLVPLVYLLSDFIEDCLLAWLLQRNDAIPAMVGVLKTFTAIKLVSVVATMVLTVATFCLWLFHLWRGALG